MVLPAIMKKYSNLRAFYSTETEFIDHLLSGEVTMPIKDVLALYDDLRSERRLPSAHQIGDKVVVSFGAESSLNNCSVIKVHFSESKVMYDVEVHGETNYPDGKGHSWTTRLYNVDSAFLTKPAPNGHID